MVDIIRRAESVDIGKIVSFLTEAKLFSDGIAETIDYFVLSEDEKGDITSVLGIEPVQNIGVLRSLAVRPSVREGELLQLFQHVYNLAISKKLSTLLLITNKEAFIPLLQFMGFERISNSSIPKELEKSHHMNLVGKLENVFLMKRAI
jgi:N-acetylglutamate synthase-like GNAT family acetyltransferase